MNSEFTVADLAARLDGWIVTAATSHTDVVEVRLAGPVEGAPGWLEAHGTLFITGEPAPDQATLIDGELRSGPEALRLGDWTVDNDRLLTGQLLETAIIVTPPPAGEPARQPTGWADRILTDGELVWPPPADLPEESRGFELLESVTRIALAQPSLLSTVQVDTGTESRIWDTFVTEWAAIEVERHPGTDDPAAVSYFPLNDIPSRLWHRSGVACLISPGPVTWIDRHALVRTTYLTDEGLVMGALEWDQSSDGILTTSDGPRRPMAIASELLRLLPGGDIDLQAGKEVVGAT